MKTKSIVLGIVFGIVLSVFLPVEHYEDGSGRVLGADYCLPGAICRQETASAQATGMIDSVAAEYECQMLLAETSDMLPEDIVEACQP